MIGHRRKGSVLAASLLVSISVSACGSGHGFLSPPLNARVIDARTGKPIAGVIVTMWSPEDAKARLVGQSDVDGWIHLPQLQGELGGAFPFVMDRYMPAGKVRFESAHHLPKEIDSYSDRAAFEGSTLVALTRSSPPPSSPAAP